jgi:hypothetical protein
MDPKRLGVKLHARSPGGALPWRAVWGPAMLGTWVCVSECWWLSLLPRPEPPEPPEPPWDPRLSSDAAAGWLCASVWAQHVALSSTFVHLIYMCMDKSLRKLS